MAEEEKSAEKGISLDRQRLNFDVGSLVRHGDTVLRISEVLDFETVIGNEVESGRTKTLLIKDLRPFDSNKDGSGLRVISQDIDDLSDEDWDIAKQRYEAIKPLLNDADRKIKLTERALEIGVDQATLFRWLRRFNSFGIVAALVPKRRGWKTGKSRIPDDVEKLIEEVINDTYLTVQRHSPQKTYWEVLRRCKERKIKAPHSNTVRARIKALSEKKLLYARGYRELVKNRYKPLLGHFPNADYPLAVVQIDHTPVDLILVDDVHRLPIGRPWITLAIDVYSRMVVGYYLSFDPPSETSVAMCVAHAILPKEEWLELHGVNAKWSAFGIMDTIHTDNGAEFRSGNFQKSCLMHNIKLEFRPVRQPQYGGHIERLLGTFAQKIHELPGTTFSSIKDRDGYDSEKHSAMTKEEFEKWLVTLICGFYHANTHSVIGMSPERKWEIGIFGNATQQGRGLPSLPADRHSLLLDFLPSFSRTIQPYGVSIDGVNYYADVLRPLINSTSKEGNEKRKFIFRRDPRDITSVWFYDPETEAYFRIPLANQAFPSVSIWEYRQAYKKAREDGMGSANETLILQAIEDLRKQVEESKEKTKKARRQSQRRREHEKKITPAMPVAVPQVAPQESPQMAKDGAKWEEVEAFDDIS